MLKTHGLVLHPQSSRLLAVLRKRVCATHQFFLIPKEPYFFSSKSWPGRITYIHKPTPRNKKLLLSKINISGHKGRFVHVKLTLLQLLTSKSSENSVFNARRSLGRTCYNTWTVDEICQQKKLFDCLGMTFQRITCFTMAGCFLLKFIY